LVEENFKIGIDLDISQDSLEDITRKIRKSIDEAFKGIKVPSPVAGGAATVRSMRETSKVSASDHAYKLAKTLTAKDTEKAFAALNDILNRDEKVKKKEIDASKKVEKSEDKLAKANEDLAAAREEEARRTRQVAREGGSFILPASKTAKPAATSVAGGQQGPTNIRIGANIDVRRAAGSQRTAGGGAAGGGNPKASILGDAPREKTGKQAYQSPAEKQSEKGSRYEAGAAAVAKEVSASIQDLRSAIVKAAGGKVDEKFFERIGLAGSVKAGAGASPVVERIGKGAEHIGRTIQIVDGKLSQFSNVITDRIRELTSPAGAERFGRMSRTAARDKGAFEAQSRQMIGEVFGGLASVEKGKPLAAFQKGGEAQLTVKVSGALQERLSALEDEASVIGDLNKVLWQASQGVGELAGEFQKLKAAGIDVMTTFGLSESIAASAQVERGERPGPGKPKIVESVTLPVQTRNLADMGIGGIGAMRAARSFQPTQLMELLGGGVPSVMGKGEREAYKTGLIKPGAYKEAKTALVDPGVIPELLEDQILFDPNLLKMPMKQVRSMLVHELAQGITEGARLAEGQTLGTQIGGEAILFDKKGMGAQVKSIEKAVVDGMEAYRIEVEEINETITGMKLTERSGIKGIAKAVPNLAQKYGLPEGTAAAISTSAVARRGSLRLPIEMMSNTIADASGVAAQEIADKIVAAMSEGGQEFAAAIKQVAEAYGLKGFTGAEVVTKGPIAESQGGQASIMTGKVALGRLPKAGMTGAMDISERFFNASDVQGLKMSAQSASMASSMQENISRLTKEFGELRAVLSSLVGDSDQAAAAVKDLSVILPESLKRLPQAAVAESDLKGTLLDPDLHQALALQLPTRTGEKLMRIPSVGTRPGERESFKTEIGTIGAGAMTRQLDRIMEQATKVRTLRGQVPITENADAMEEASNLASKAIRDQVGAIVELGIESKEGAAAVEQFIQKMEPLIQMLGKGPSGIKFIGQGGEQKEIKRSAANYVKFFDEAMTKPRDIKGQMFAAQDVLAQRAGGGTKVAGLGGVFNNLDVLNKVMDMFQVQLNGTGEAAEKAMARLEKLEEGLISMVAEAALSAEKVPAYKRSAASGREAGASLAPVGLAVEFPTDVSKELAAVGERLQQMKAAGANVDEALSAFGRMSALQASQKGIPRDAVLINEEDWKNLVNAVSKKYKIPEPEAIERLQRPGLVQRYPITGPRSFLPGKLSRVGEDVLPRGNLGVAGPAAISSPEDLKAMLQPLMELKSAKLGRLEQLGGAGEEAQQLATDITELSRVTSNLIPVFRMTGLNLDFDGDKIFFHGDVAKRAASNLETFSASTKKVINLQEIFIGVLGKAISKGGMGGVEDYSKFFGQVVKGRPEGLRKAVLRPEDEEMAGFEAQAHIAGKKSVAILADAFNSTSLAITTGSDKLGDSMETAIGSIMLGINESLAQKHGTGGLAGPSEFLKMFSGGQIGKIQEGLKGKEGFMSQLGERNRQMKPQIREQMLVAGAGPGGMDRLKDFFDAEGIGEKMAAELKSGNLTSIVDKAVEELDLGNVLKRMFELMKQNMIRALTQGGKTLEQATGEVYDLLKPKGKTGFIKGLDPTEIIKQLVPGYAMTRQRIVKKEIEPLSPTEKAKKALSLIPQRVADEAGSNLQLEEPDVKGPAQALAQILKSWLDGIREKVTFITKEKMQELTGFRAGGAYLFKKSAPKEGIIVARQDKLQQFEESLALLGQIASGLVDPTKMSVDALRELRNNLKQLVETLGHENVHKYSKDWQSAVANIVRSLKSAQGVLALGGEHGAEVRGFIGRTGNVAIKYQRARMAEESLKRGATETTIPTAKGEGDEVIQNLTADKVKELMDAAMRSIAEELLAYQFNPEQFSALMGGAKGAAGVPVAVSDFLKNQLNMLAKARPEVLEAAMQAAKAINSGYLQGLIETAENAGPADARQAAESRASSLLNFAGRGRFLQGQDVLGTQERGIMESRQIHKLSAAERLPSGQLGFGQMRKLGGAARPELAGVAQEVKAIQDAIIAGVAPEELNDMLRKVRGLAGKTSAIVSRLTKSGALSGVSPINEMVSVVQDFFMTVAQKMTTEARELQRQIAEMESKGQIDTPEFGALLEKFDRKVVDINTWLEKASTERMGKHGQLAVGGVTSLKGEMLPGFKGLGLDVANVKNFEGVIGGMAGEGKEGARFASLFKDELIKAAEAARKGASATEIWSRIFAIMKQHPAEMKDDATKLAAIFTALGRIVGTQDQQFASAATNLAEAGKNAKKMRDALEGISPKDYQQVAAAMAGATKTQKRAFARGMGTDQAGSVMEQQRSAMEAMEGRRKMLEKLVKTPDYKAMGAPRHFEKQQFDIVDPQTGQVIQKLSAEFKRMGNTIKASMSQGGAATAAFGNQLQNSLRRVVQWGFASGIIYGTVRAFHNLVSVLTTVDSKMAELKKVMNTSITDFTAMQDAAVGMAKGFGISIEDVLDGMVVYAQQGLTMNETMERTRATLMAVNVTTLTSTEATDALTSVMKSFGDEVSSSMMAVDSWAAVAATTAVSAKDLAVAIQRSGSAAKASGVGFHDLLGLTASIGSVTRQSGAEVATGIKFMLRSMGRPAAQKSLLGVGVKSQDVTGNLKPSMDILGDLAGRWDKLSSSQKMNTAQAIAGIRHYNQFMVLMEHWTDALDASATSQTAQGFATRKNEIALGTFSKQMQTLRETVKSLAIDLGKTMLPAMSMVVGAVQLMVSALDMLPDSLKAVGVAGVAGMLAFHKAADVVLDTLTAIGGTDTTDKIKKKGIIGSALGAGASVVGSWRTASALSTAPSLKGAAGSIGGIKPVDAKNLKDAMEAARFDKETGNVGMLAKAFFLLQRGTVAWAASLTTLKGIMITTGIGALAVALGFLAAELMKAGKTGKDVEDEMFDMIGKAQDTANAFKSQGMQIGKITHMWDKYASAVETAADPAKLRAALGDGNFKSPLKALKDYEDAIYSTGKAFASLDPSMIEGISDTGEYIYTASDGMKALTVSAADAQNATVAAMQTKVIKAYADEITKAKGAWARFQEIISLGTKKMDLITQIGNVRDKIQELGKEMQDLASKGISPTSMQSEMNGYVKEELELRGQILASADELKRVLDQMPRFENTDLAFTALSSSDFKNSMQSLAMSGGAGREASAGSLQMRGMARQVGLGGLVGTETTANADRMLQDLLERGIKTRQGAPTAAGQIGAMSPEAARLMLGAATGKTLKEGEKPKEVERARTVITGMNQLTGELVYYFENGLTDAIDKLDDSEVTMELRKAMETMFTMDRSSLEAAAERGRKLLTLQATGAMAGIRVPEGGMPDIGPGTFRETSVEQRVMGTLPDELERLATIQSELTEISKKYNESLDEGSAVSEEFAGTLKNNINTMSQTTRDLVRAMKIEEFDLTNLAHIHTAFAKLEQTLLDAGKAARDAAIEEETRADLLKHTSGAMAGLAVAPQLDLGKSFRELTAGERLQKEMGPGFSRTLSKIAGVESKYSAGIQKTTDIRKQIGDFDEMNANLEKARGTLTKELENSVKAELTGTTKDTQTLIDHMQQMNEASLSELQKQTPILDRILEAMKTSIKVQAADSPEKKMEAMTKGLGEIESSRLLELMGAGGKKVLESFIGTDVGLPLMSAEERGMSADKRKIAESSIKFSSEESRAQFEDVRARLKEAMERADRAAGVNPLGFIEGDAAANLSPAERNQMPQANRDEILSLQKELLSNEDVAKASKNRMGLYARQEVAEKQQNQLKEVELRKQNLLNQIAEARARVMGQLTSAEQQAYAETEAASRILMAKEGFRLAEATMGFALAMENVIKDFQKAEMLAYEKQGSDIEGAFARVGQPGFKTTFEQQREEIEARRGLGPRTLDEMRSDVTDMDKVDFDEKEARIKEEQDIEVSALRQQQSQAESIRSLLADQLMGGDLPSDLEGMTRNYLDTLTQELATSEQANAGALGEDLTFQGVPALDDARNFLQQIQESAKETARKAELAFQQQINQPLLDQQKITNQLLMGIKDNTAGSNMPGTALTGEGMMSGGAAVATYGGAPVGQQMTSTTGMAPAAPGDIMNWMSKLGDAGNRFEMRGDLGGGSKPSYDLGKRIGGTQIYQGESDTGVGDFVKEQTLGAATGTSGPLTAMEKLKTLMEIEKKSPATDAYVPTGMFRGGTGPLAFSDREDTTFGDAQNQVGASNYNQVLEANNALKLGNRAFTSSSTVTDSENGRTPGSQVDDVATGKATPGSEGQTEALTSLSDQFSTLIEAINALVSTPDQGSQEIVSAITDSSAALTELLGGTLTVSVDNVPTVSIEGLEDALSGAFSSSGLGSVGSEVADARLRLEVLEGIIDPSGPSVEDRITAATEAISANLDVAGTTLTTLEESLGALTSQVEALAPLTDLDTQVTSLEEGVTTLTAQVETNTSAITTVQTNVDENTNLINELTAANEEFKTSVDVVVASNAETVALVEEFETAIEDMTTRVAAAEATVTAAAATVTDLQDSLTALSTSIDSNKQSSEAADRELSDALSKLETKITQNTTDIQVVRGKSETALSQAQQALNLARQSGR
jgi:TP901 family phage tail tape measure protein